MDVTTARHTAVRLLSTREHAAAELLQKLTQRGCSQMDAQAVLAWCQEHDLQSDERYTDSYIRQRAARRYGKLRIRAELQARHVDTQIIAAKLAGADVDWVGYAMAALQRRNDDLSEYRQVAKAGQALMRRGYSREELQSAIERLQEST